LKKALRALKFMNGAGEATVTEVAQAVGVPRTTAYRLLGTLACEGYVEKQDNSDIYRLTSEVRRLSSGFGDINLIIEIAKPLIEQAGNEIRWPLALATPEGTDMVVRVTTDFHSSFALERFPIRYKVPILHAPAGLCYLAYCDQETRDTIIHASKSRQSHTHPNLEILLDQIRFTGYCHMHFHEYKENGLAVPLIIRGRIEGGLIMRYIQTALSDENIRENYFPILKKLGSDISRAYDITVGDRIFNFPMNGSVHDGPRIPA
jgi:IclR family mhp operon transcriptional activator